MDKKIDKNLVISLLKWAGEVGEKGDFDLDSHKLINKGKDIWEFSHAVKRPDGYFLMSINFTFEEE